MANITIIENTRYCFDTVRKMCECRYFFVAINPDSYTTDFAIFSDELAAKMFADNINSYVDYDYEYVCIK